MTELVHDPDHAEVLEALDTADAVLAKPGRGGRPAKSAAVTWDAPSTRLPNHLCESGAHALARRIGRPRHALQMRSVPDCRDGSHVGNIIDPRNSQ
jgi:hypothetical protein